MTINIIPEGFKDDVTSLVSTEHNFKNIIINLFQINGFQLVKTPLIEYYGINNDKNLFKLVVNKKEKKLVIRDDITLQIARLSKTRLKDKVKPLKLCYYGEVVRKKGTMLRPERQFLQIGAESIGENNYLADVEMIELAYKSLSMVGIKNLTIEISSKVFFDKFINKIKNLPKKNEIKRLIRLKDLESLEKNLNQKYYKEIKNIFLCTGSYKDKKNNLKKLNLDNESQNEIYNIINVIEKFLSNNTNVNIFLDFCEINDKKYHSGINFTFFASNIRGEIAKGGRYSVSTKKNDILATGFTCYMDTILRASSKKIAEKKIIIPFDTSKININKLIKKNFVFIRYTGNLSINRRLAKDYNCRYYLDNNSIKRI